MTSATSKLDRGKTLEILRALADETRFHILLLIESASSPISAQKVADVLSLHPNTIRPHLEKLREVGFLELVISSDGRVGRPQHLYRLSPNAPRFGVEPGKHLEAAAIMVETLEVLGAQIEAIPEQALEIGRAWGRRLEEDAFEDDIEIPGMLKDRNIVGKIAEAVFRESQRLGFEPTRAGNEVFFNSCPFRPVVEKFPELACAAHEGICEGIAEMLCHEEFAGIFHKRGPNEPCSIAFESMGGDSTDSG